MSTSRWSRIAGSRGLLIFLLLVSSALAVGSYHAATANLPPQIAGYNWSRYPNTLLLSVPADDCGCGLLVAEWISMGATHGLQVLVVSAQPNPQLSTLKKALPSSRCTFLFNVKKEVVQSLSPKDQVTFF